MWIKRFIVNAVIIVLLSLLGTSVDMSTKAMKVTPTIGTSFPKTTSTATKTVTPTSTFTPIFTVTESFTPTDTIEPTITDTVTYTVTPSVTSTAQDTNTPSAYTEPYASAPLCPDSGMAHDNSQFHTLWDRVRGCHYDHEHGTNPFTTEVMNNFPGFDLYSLLGNVEIGHTNPSSAMENTMKHGGFKWDIMLDNPHGCTSGFEGSQYCIESSAIQYHSFGDLSMELEAHIHSAAALLKVCNPSNPSDCGYIYTVQHEEYGQRITPYQGNLIPYPNSPVPSYDTPSGPYWSVDCVGAVIQCRSSLDFIKSRSLFTNSTVSSKPTGIGVRPAGSTILRLLFRVRDTSEVFDNNDFEYPFTYLIVCSSDGGQTYNPNRCLWNNTTGKIHEISGVIPASWDNISGFDTNPQSGRITAEGFTDRFGTLDLSCTQAGGNCFPIKMKDMFVGQYGDYTLSFKPSNTTVVTNPERDIYFCNGIVCSESSSGAVPSGWVGLNN